MLVPTLKSILKYYFPGMAKIMKNVYFTMIINDPIIASKVLWRTCKINGTGVYIYKIYPEKKN